MHKTCNNFEERIKIFGKSNNWLKMHGYPMRRGKWPLLKLHILKDPCLDITVSPEQAERFYKRNENAARWRNYDFSKIWEAWIKCLK